MRQLEFFGLPFLFTRGHNMKLPYDQIFDENPRLIRNADNMREFRTGLAELHPDEPLSIETFGTF
jgi:hypothetical protein